MDAIIDIAISKGIGVGCILYFMLRDYKFMDTMTQTLRALDESVSLIEDYFIKKGIVSRETLEKGRDGDDLR